MKGLRALLAVLDLEFEPAGVVMGAGVFQVYRPAGCRGLGFKTSGEPLIYTAYEEVLRQAWASALGRLQDEARAAGAHGVLGINVTQTWSGGAPSHFQLQLTGTAVRLRGQPPSQRPSFSTLSMSDFLKLLMGGWVP